MLLLLVFGINTAIQAQTTIIITDNKTEEQYEYTLPENYTEAEFETVRTQVNSTYGSPTASSDGSFGITIIRWDYGGVQWAWGDFYFREGTSMNQIANILLQIFYAL